MEANADWSFVYRQRKKIQHKINSFTSLNCMMLINVRTIDLSSIWKLATTTQTSKPSTDDFNWSINVLLLAFSHKLRLLGSMIALYGFCLMEMSSIWKFATAPYIAKPSQNHIERQCLSCCYRTLAMVALYDFCPIVDCLIYSLDSDKVQTLWPSSVYWHVYTKCITRTLTWFVCLVLTLKITFGINVLCGWHQR